MAIFPSGKSSSPAIQISSIKKNLGDYIRFTFIITENKYKTEVYRIIKELYIQGGMCSPLKPDKKVIMWDLGDYYQGINTVYKCNKFKNIPRGLFVDSVKQMFRDSVKQMIRDDGVDDGV